MPDACNGSATLVHVLTVNLTSICTPLALMLARNCSVAQNARSQGPMHPHMFVPACSGGDRRGAAQPSQGASVLQAPVMPVWTTSPCSPCALHQCHAVWLSACTYFEQPRQTAFCHDLADRMRALPSRRSWSGRTTRTSATRASRTWVASAARSTSASSCASATASLMCACQPALLLQVWTVSALLCMRRQCCGTAPYRGEHQFHMRRMLQ